MLAVYAVKKGDNEITGERLDEKWYMTYKVALEDYCKLIHKYSNGIEDVTVIVLDLDSEYVMAKVEILTEEA